MNRQALAQDPVRVAPFIKLSRWALLIAGVFYGVYHNARLSKKEQKLREIEAKNKEIRDAELLIEKKRSAEAETRALAILSKPARKPSDH